MGERGNTEDKKSAGSEWLGGQLVVLKQSGGRWEKTRERVMGKNRQVGPNEVDLLL